MNNSNSSNDYQANLIDFEVPFLSSQEIRSKFLKFYNDRGHKIIPSAPIVSKNDPSTLFVNSGMMPLKSVFLGDNPNNYKRICNSQKVLRVSGKHNDLEEVGLDDFHHTFFEMLGHWSFDDYFKKDTIIWGYQLLTEVYNLPKNRLFATVHKDDHHAYNIWQKYTDIKNDHILKFTTDNFWEMGKSGPCGFCSEVHFDRGNLISQKDTYNHKNLGVNGNNHRYIELINFVFIDSKKSASGEISLLDKKNIDTGAGLERLSSVIQGTNGDYNTDLFKPIIDKICLMSKSSYHDNDSGKAHRIISDHMRALCFGLSDGVKFSAGGAGYVLKRILRRALRYATKLTGSNSEFLYHLVDPVIVTLSSEFPELKKNQNQITKLILAEEKKFLLTLASGEKILQSLISDAKKKKLDFICGKEIFKLYDTYGFPYDLSAEIALESNIKINRLAFDEKMARQKTMARGSQKFLDVDKDQSWHVLKHCQNNEFCGYDTLKIKSNTLRYRILDCHEIAQNIKSKNKQDYRSDIYHTKKDFKDLTIIEIQLEKTPFYATAGGQAGDKGLLYNDYMKLEVLTTYYQYSDIIHRCQLISGSIDQTDAFDEFICSVDQDYRMQSKAHHSATHLLHSALKKHLGEHVHQQGAYSNNYFLRFDFSHDQKLSLEQLKNIEFSVNQAIKENLEVTACYMDLQEALQSGAESLAGEKYDHKSVRVITMHKKAINCQQKKSVCDLSISSKELCGGTHVKNTSEIGYFLIVSESSIASGIRRIVAKAGWSALNTAYAMKCEISMLYNNFNLPADFLYDNITKNYTAKNRLLSYINDLNNLNNSLKSELNHMQLEKIKSYVKSFFSDNLYKSNDASYDFVIAKLPDVFDKKDLNVLAEQVVEGFNADQSYKNCLVILYMVSEGAKNSSSYSINLLCLVASNLQLKVSAKQIVQSICKEYKGAGGGRVDRAQGGIKFISKPDLEGFHAKLFQLVNNV